MTTVTGSVSIDFSGIGDVNPWTDANVSVVTDNNMAFQVLNGLLTSGSGSAYAGFIYNASAPSGTITSKAELGRDSTLYFDPDGPAIIDASGNGYWLRVVHNDIRIYRLDAWVPTLIGASINQAFNLYDRVELELNPATGALVSRHEGTQLDTVTDTTYSTNLYAGAVKNRDNSLGARGIRSWAADGYATTDSITTDGATVPGSTESYTPSGFASGTPNAGTLTQGTRSITLTSVNGTQFTVPAIADQGAACLFGTDVTVTITNGTEQATDTMTWLPSSGLDYVTLTSLSSDQSSLLLAWNGTAEVGGQLIFPDTWTVNAAAEIVSAPEGVSTCYYISPSEGANTVFEAFTVTIGADGQIVLSIKKLASRKLNSVKLTSSKLIG